MLNPMLNYSSATANALVKAGGTVFIDSSNKQYVDNALQQIAADIVTVTTIKGQVEDYKDAAEESATAASSSALSAATHAANAAASATAANSAQDAAESAQSKAETAAGSAATSATAAQTAQAAAEAAQTAAETAQAGAEQAKDDAQDLVNEAQDIAETTAQETAQNVVNNFVQTGGPFTNGITVDKQITLHENPETDTSESVLQHKEYGFNFYDVEEGTDLSGKSLFFDTGISPLDDSNFNGTSLETLISFQNGYTLYVNPNVSPSNYSVYMATPSGGISYFYLNGQWITDVYTFTGSGWVVSSIEKENFESDAAQTLADMITVGTFFVPSRTRFDEGAQIPLTPSGAFDVANKQYVDSTLKTEAGYLQQAIDNEASARAAADTALRNSKYDKTGGTIDGNVQITGNLTVQGTTTTNDTETLAVKDNLIVTNSDGATLSGLSGLIIRTSPTQSYGIVYDPANEGTAKLGLGTYNAETGVFTFATGEGLPVAVRALSTAWSNLHLAAWDAASNQFVDAGKAVADFQEKLTFDTTPTQNSTNPVTSGGVFAALQGKQNTLTEGEGILISDTDVISFDTTVLDGYVTETGLTETLAGYVTLDTAQKITGTKYFGSIVVTDGTLGNNGALTIHDTFNFTVAIGGLGPVYTFSFPTGKSGTQIPAFLSDIEPVSEQVSDLSQSVDDIYTILQQEVYNSQDIEQEYSSRETADGADIIDGALETVKKIQGATVKTTNLIPFPYEGTTTTVNGVTITNNNNGSVTINGTATGIAIFTFCHDANKMNLHAGTTYYFTCAHGILAYTDTDGTHYIFAGSSFTWGTGWTFVSIYIQLNAGESETNLTVYPMLNEGSSALPYMPYFSGLKNAYFKGLRSTGRNLYTYAGVENNETQFANCTEFEILDGGNVIIAKGNEGTNTNFQYDSGWVRPNNGNTQYYINLYKVANVNISADITLIEQGSRSAEVRCYLYYLGNVGDIAPINSKAITSTKTRYTWTLSLTNSGLAYPIFAINSNKVQIENISVSYTEETNGYEPYVSHEISLDAAIELPAWDSINPTTGKRTVQSNTLTFDGTESGWGIQDSGGLKELYFWLSVPAYRDTDTINFVSNHFNDCARSDISNPGDMCANANYIRVLQEADMTLESFKSKLSEWNTAGDPLTVCYHTATATESDIEMEDRLPAYKNGSETVIQGDTDNSEYGAENTLTQNYAEVKGTTGTTEGGNS